MSDNAHARLANIFINKSMTWASFLIALVFALYTPVIYDLIIFWWNSEEYSYGLLMPIVAGYIVYQQRNHFFTSDQTLNAHRSYISGSILLLVSCLIYIASVIADIESIKRYTFILSLASIALNVGGWKLLRQVIFPLLLLLFALPLPYLLGAILTTKMQLVSSDLGVLLIRVMGLPVFQDGNVINMSGFQMLVAEACSGLRYLYPLMAIALIITYFYCGGFFLKIGIFLLAIPITIGMNSLRIAITGLLIKLYGKQAAEGFLHDFEGWLVFAVAFVLLIVSVWLMSSLKNLMLNERVSFSDRFNMDVKDEGMFLFSENEHKNLTSHRHTLVTYYSLFFSVIALISMSTVFYLQVNSPEASIPKRSQFTSFPFHLDQREIYPELLSKSVKDVLRADDYFIADYKKLGAADINLYIVYYENQKDGSALHSPKACLPGGGWRITESSTVDLTRFGNTGKANRAIIEQNGQKLLVYYWIRQNANNYANEFKARLSLLKQSISTGRTDGALIRVIRPIVSIDGQDEIAIAEQDVASFISSFMPVLPLYLPN